MSVTVQIKNYRCFVDASTTLQPFTLLIGANGSGKTSFLRFLQLLSMASVSGSSWVEFGNQSYGTYERNQWIKHKGHPDLVPYFKVEDSYGIFITGGQAGVLLGPSGPDIFRTTEPTRLQVAMQQLFPFNAPLFSLNPLKIGATEVNSTNAIVQSDGTGVTAVLEALKTGDREDLFDQIEAAMQRYMPEVEKISTFTPTDGQKQIQIRECGVGVVPALELSEGTRLLLAVLTIIHQEKPPRWILLEDIDRGMHPRIFEGMAELMRRVAKDHGINIVATTHNPYLVDHFRDCPEAVILVEKKDGASTLTTLKDRIEQRGLDGTDVEGIPLGQLWYSGLLGAVPMSSIKKRA